MRICDLSSDVCSSYLDRTCREALLNTAAQAAMCLLREVFEEQRVHRALEADVQFGDFTLRERDERHPRELEMLVEGGDVRLIARHAVEGFRDHDIELARLRVGQQLLNGEIGRAQG